MKPEISGEMSKSMLTEFAEQSRGEFEGTIRKTG